MGNGSFETASPFFAGQSIPSLREDQKARLLEQADRLLAGRFSFFDLEDLTVDKQIDWNFDYSAKKHSPKTKSSRIDYRDFDVAGDCKLVWEPNRHQHLVVLARAHAVSGKIEYARAVLDQIDSWMDQCPFPTGMNWRSPLEFGVRIINWVWAFELIKPSGLLTQERWRTFVPTVHRHLWCLDRSYSRYSSANNHVIGEAAGAYIAARYFNGFAESNRWAERAKQILEEEIANQTHPDGGNKEQALGYHVFVLEFFLLAGLVGRNVGDEFSKVYWGHIERMFDYVASFVEGGGNLPLYGDYDDGYVLDLGDRLQQPQAMLAVAGAIFERPEFTALAGECNERAAWQLNQDVTPSPVAESPSAVRLESKAFADTGYYLLQNGAKSPASEVDDRMSVVFDCAELGMGSLAAHGHADALSVTLRAFGYDVLVDPGTYDYFTHRQWRDYFKSTRAHNTIAVDGQDQSELLGLFLWGERAEAKCVDWSPSATGGSVSGEHTGYRRLRDPVGHRRTVELDGSRGELVITDELTGKVDHCGEICFHFSEFCSVEEICDNAATILAPFGSVQMTLDSRLEVRAYCGQEAPIFGWVSRGYHKKVPCPTIVGKLRWTGNTSLVTRICLHRSPVHEAGNQSAGRSQSLPPQGGLGFREVSHRGV
ncbi:MAG: hypothetical protein DHS20C16_15910 [Phycisphaerae bacterium]|nr:MAG: hypothetical protein DHS20C16_15910 [Phycisphaerae bacterium]